MKRSGIHATAIVSPNTRIGSGVEIGPFAIVGDGCEIGDDCQISPRAILERDVRLGNGVKVGVGSVLGGPPQDLKYAGEQTTVEIGDETVIREYTTINRGTSQSFKTTVGERCLLMSYVHLAHDCHIGNGVILGNSVQLAGHVIGLLHVTGMMSLGIAEVFADSHDQRRVRFSATGHIAKTTR